MRKSFILDKIIAFNKNKSCFARLFYKEPVSIQNLRKLYQELNKKDGTNRDRDLNSHELLAIFQILDKADREIQELFWDYGVWMILWELRRESLFTIENMNKILKISHREDQILSISNILDVLSNTGIQLTQEKVDQVVEFTEDPTFYDTIWDLYQEDYRFEEKFNAVIKQYESSTFFVAKKMNTIAMGSVNPNSTLHRFFGSHAGKPLHPLGEVELLKNVKTFLQAK